MKKIFFVFVFSILYLFVSAQKTGTFIDSRDGKTYKTVKIGTQIWMAENLNYETDSGSWCFDDKIANCDTTGRLYNWQMAMQVCPDSWHLPSFSEWMQLAEFINKEKNPFGRYVEENENVGQWGNIAYYLKSTTGWNWRNGINYYNFNAYPSGEFNGENYIVAYHAIVIWWSSTEVNKEEAKNIHIFTQDHYLYFYLSSKNSRKSVRCLKN